MNTPETNNYTYLAIDVSQGNLQIFSPYHKTALPNCCEGRRGLVKLARAQQKKTKLQTVVVFEPTGGYERDLIEALDHAKIRWARVQGERINAWGKAQGKRAKTDKIDAEKIYDYAVFSHTKPTQPSEAAQKVHQALMDRREQLVGLRAKERTRSKNCEKLMLKSVLRTIDFLTKEIEMIEALIKENLEKSPTMQVQFQAMCKVKGVGDVTAWAYLAYMADAANVSRAEAAALAGLVPFDQQSGTQKKRAHIQGGRAKIRKYLYMAALAATKYNPVIKEFYERLIANHKPAKVALVAAMRKMTIYLRSVLIDPTIVDEKTKKQVDAA